MLSEFIWGWELLPLLADKTLKELFLIAILLLNKLHTISPLRLSSVVPSYILQWLNFCRKPDWYLIDGIKGGSGETYDWAKMHPPEIHEDMQGWLLAGGLNPENVGQAITMLNPPIVDVSSGVTTPDGITKDPEKVFKFVEAVRRAALQLEQQNWVFGQHECKWMSIETL